VSCNDRPCRPRGSRGSALPQSRSSSAMADAGAARRKASSRISAISSQSTVLSPGVSRYTPSQPENVPLADGGGLKNRRARCERALLAHRAVLGTTARPGRRRGGRGSSRSAWRQRRNRWRRGSDVHSPQAARARASAPFGGSRVATPVSLAHCGWGSSGRSVPPRVPRRRLERSGEGARSGGGSPNPRVLTTNPDVGQRYWTPCAPT